VFALEETEQTPPEESRKPDSLREEFTRAAGGVKPEQGEAEGMMDRRREAIHPTRPSRAIHPANPASATGTATTGSDRASRIAFLKPIGK